MLPGEEKGLATLRSWINARASPLLEPKIVTDDAESDIKDDDAEDDYLVGGVCFNDLSSVRSLRPLPPLTSALTYLSLTSIWVDL